MNEGLEWLMWLKLRVNMDIHLLVEKDTRGI